MRLLFCLHPFCSRAWPPLCSAAHKLYPVRVKLVNDMTGAAEWHTVAYIPVVRTEQESSAAERGRIRRCGMLQRMLYLAFRSMIGASHDGARLELGDHVIRAFPRILLYVCDQPEERAVLGLKSGRCSHPCSNCDVHVSVLGGAQALRARQRGVVVTLERELEGFRCRRDNRMRQRRLALEAVDSTTSLPPALACMAGLSSPPYLLFNMIGFDILHVRYDHVRGCVCACVPVCACSFRCVLRTQPRPLDVTDAAMWLSGLLSLSIVFI